MILTDVSAVGDSYAQHYPPARVNKGDLRTSVNMDGTRIRARDKAITPENAIRIPRYFKLVIVPTIARGCTGDIIAVLWL